MCRCLGLCHSGFVPVFVCSNEMMFKGHVFSKLCLVGFFVPFVTYDVFMSLNCSFKTHVIVYCSCRDMIAPVVKSGFSMCLNCMFKTNVIVYVSRIVIAGVY